MCFVVEWLISSTLIWHLFPREDTIIDRYMEYLTPRWLFISRWEILPPEPPPEHSQCTYEGLHRHRLTYTVFSCNMFLYIPWNKGLSHPIKNYSVIELPHSVAFNIGVVLKPILMLHHTCAALLEFLITGCTTTCLILRSDWNRVKGCFYLLFFILPRWMELLVAPSCLSINI